MGCQGWLKGLPPRDDCSVYGEKGGGRVSEVLFISQHLCAECCDLQRAMDPALREPTVSWEETAINLGIVQMCNYKLWYLVKKN